MNENEKQIEAEDIYKNEGIAIFVKGEMMVGIHSNDVENSVEALSDGSMKINWRCLLDTANHNPIVDEGKHCIIEYVNKDEK